MHCEKPHRAVPRVSTSQILELAARENEDLVDNALQALLEEERGITAQAVKE